MSLIKRIFELEPVSHRTYEDYNLCDCELEFEGKKYYGYAECHPNDEAFFSEKVGLNIAVARARIKLLEDLAKKAKQVYDIKYQMYHEVAGFGTDVDVFGNQKVDPTDKFKINLENADYKYKRLKTIIKQEKTNLKEYIKIHDKMVKTLTHLRNKGKKE